MNQWCSQHRITETDFFRACRPSAFRGLQAFRPFRPSAVLPLTVTCARFGVWSLAESGVSSQQPELSRATTAAAGPPGHGWSLTHNSQIGSKSLRMWQCDDCDDTTTTTNEPNNFSLSLQELQCNCSATHWPCIRIVSVLQHNCKYSFSVYPFITTPPAGACSEGEKKKACRRAVRSVCDCIMFSFSVVCDRYTNTSVTVTVTESLL